jgi:Taurine catabolism dioxygenase TauD, TfdA family
MTDNISQCQQNYRIYQPNYTVLSGRRPPSAAPSALVQSYAKQSPSREPQHETRRCTDSSAFRRKCHWRGPQFVYRHRWQVGDLVISDNRCTMYRATPFEATDHVRDMRRTTIIDRAPGSGRQIGHASKHCWRNP